MVGRDEGGGNQRQDVSGLCGLQESASLRAEGTGVSERGDEALAQRTRTAEGSSGCRAAAEAATPLKLHDERPSSEIFKGCTKDPASCPVLSCRLVYWLAPERDNRP